jgi:hypothetical protein
MLAELLEEDFDIALVDTQLDGQVDRGRRHGRHGRAEGACRQGSGHADRRTASCHAGDHLFSAFGDRLAVSEQQIDGPALDAEAYGCRKLCASHATC